MTIREMTANDLERAVEINQTNLRDVDSITIDELSRVLDDSRIALVAVEPGGSVVGFCLVIDQQCSHPSARAQWALRTQTSPSALHIDRVMFDMRFSGFGLGLALFEELDRRVTELATTTESGTIALTSLVRVDPPNEHSVGFHRQRGFETLDRATFDEGVFALTRREYAGAER
jgi:predicted GNAT superfamily acetyltransferase